MAGSSRPSLSAEGSGEAYEEYGGEEGFDEEYLLEGSADRVGLFDEYAMKSPAGAGNKNEDDAERSAGSELGFQNASLRFENLISRRPRRRAGHDHDEILVAPVFDGMPRSRGDGNDFAR